MKMKLSEIKEFILSEIKKKKSKKGSKKSGAEKEKQPNGYTSSPVHDFSQPQGEKNLYRHQGSASFGPMTNEAKLRKFIQECIREGLSAKENGITLEQLKSKKVRK